MLHLFKYHLRSVFVRWRSTLATILGLALVVAVFVVLQALAAGIESASGSTGDPRNLLVVRQGALAETTSIVTREQYNIIRYQDSVAHDTDGQPLATADVDVILNLPRIDGSGSANAFLRGVGPKARGLRPQVQLIEGRWFESGRREVVVSKRLAVRFANMRLGDHFKSGGVEMNVVGYFDAGGSAFDSEMWMDADEVRNAFDRPDFSSVLLRPASPEAAATLKPLLEAERRLKMKVVPETAYYKEQTRSAMLPRMLGNGLAVIMSIGAMFAAMNTLYASVSARTREVGTLRVLGYRRRTILLGFLLEGAILAAVGGVLGCIFALPMQGYSAGTIGWESFTETVFNFRITPALALRGIVFSVGVGLVGSLLPAIRAARLPVIASLKSV